MVVPHVDLQPFWREFQSSMTQPSATHRVCPTRIDGRAVLFAHKVCTAQCQERQRDRYHKCFTCVHNNAWSTAKGQRNGQRPERVARERSTTPTPTPQPAEAGEEAKLAATRV